MNISNFKSNNNFNKNFNDNFNYNNKNHQIKINNFSNLNENNGENISIEFSMYGRKDISILIPRNSSLRKLIQKFYSNLNDDDIYYTETIYHRTKNN